MKIMYVEDNPANISLLQRIARMGGHEVINYTNGEYALNNFAADHPDLVLMDLQLEGRMSGLDIVKALRERGFKTPIVAVTAYAMVGDRERCLEAGCDSYLSKPLPVAELVELVQTYEQKQKNQPAAQPEVPAAQAEAPAVKVEETVSETKADLPPAAPAADTAAERL
jgi:two-component system cell cycle response regulator DivK